MASVLAAGIAALGFFSAGGFNSPALAAPPFPDSVSAPAGYQVTCAHNFTTQGMGDWVTQPGAGATVSVSSSYGLGVGVTGEDQWAEVISSDAVIGPNSFVQGLVYIPPGPNGSTANWPAFWSTGSPWPNNGEIDMLEGQGSAAHNGQSGTDLPEPGRPQQQLPLVQRAAGFPVHRVALADRGLERGVAVDRVTG